jgi:hypothetical protein
MYRRCIGDVPAMYQRCISDAPAMHWRFATCDVIAHVFLSCHHVQSTTTDCAHKKRAGYHGLLVDFVWAYIGHMAYIGYISCTLGLLPPIYIKYLVMYHIYVLNINYTWVEHRIHWLNIAYEGGGKWLGNVGKEATGVTIRSHLP